MRILITGVDDQGRSYVVEERMPSGQPYESGGITVAVAAASESFAPPSRPPGRGEHLSVVATPGTARWTFIDFPPGVASPFHHTDSLDFDVVLDDGPHRLGPGDGVVINGVDHGWETHDQTCRMSVVVIATPPPDGEDA